MATLKEKKRKLKKMRARNIILNMVCVCLAVSGLWWTITYFWRYINYEVTNDAFVDQYVAPLNIRASGYIKDIRFKEHQYVRQGDTLLVLDNREYQIKVKEAEAALLDAHGLQDVLHSGIETSHTNIAVQDANIAEAKAKLWQLEQDYHRFERLLKEESVPEQQYEQTKAAYEAAEARYQALVAQKQAAVLAKHPQVIVLADEIYEHINYIGAHQSIAQFPEMKERTVIVNGVSKAYAMTGWRIGFIAGPEWIVKACNKLQGQYTSGPCSVSQKAAEAAYTGTQEPVKEMQKAFERRRDLIVKLAKEVPGFEVNVPQGAFYLFPKCSYFFGKSNGERKIENSDDLAMYLLEDAHVACVGGTSFGAPECIRMSYATSDENIVEAIRRIKEALAKLK